MTRVRRRVLRSDVSTQAEARRLDRIRKKCDLLDKERAALDRWMAKLRRAFHAMEKHQARVTRLEREIARLEQS